MAPRFMTGAQPSPRHVLATAKPFRAVAVPPPVWVWLPKKTSMWGNDVDGDCVTASEAFKAACSGVFISDQTVKAWATRHGVLNGAVISDVLDWMTNDGFQQDGNQYNDGGKSSVDWTNQSLLQSAITAGPVKIGVAAGQLQHAVNGTGSVATGFKQDDNYDHCVELAGYGSAGWIAQQLQNWYGVTVNLGNLSSNAPAHALFTWNAVVIIDVPSMIDITCEAWSRTPNSIVKGNNPVPSDKVFTPTPTPVPPGPPVPIPPVPVPVDVSTLQQKIDAIFAKLEAAYARVPYVGRYYVKALQVAQKAVDDALKQYELKGLQFGAGYVPIEIIQVIDGALSAAATAFPEYGPIILAAKVVIDQLLPLV